MVTLDDIKRWKVPALKDYLRKRGLWKTSNRKEELCALVYAAHKNFFLIIKQNLNMKLFTEGFLEILEIFFFKFPLDVLPRAGKKCYFWPINGSHSKIF